MNEKVKKIANSKVTKFSGVIALIIPLVTIAWSQINKSDVMDSNITHNTKNIERVERQCDEKWSMINEKLDKIIFILVK